jgi:ATP-dependent Lon protease
MTGEITVHGKVLPICGLKQKVLAAHRAGICHILFPVENARELEDIPADIREQMKLEPISHIDEALALALVPPIPRQAIAEAAPEGTAPKPGKRPLADSPVPPQRAPQPVRV